MGEDAARSQEMAQAIERQDVAGVELLLDAGVNPNGVCAVNEFEVSFLRKAVQFEHIACVSALLARGANVHERSQISGEPLIMTAAKMADAQLCDVLIAHGANPNDCDRYGHTALTSVGRASSNRDRIFQATAKLIELGADVTAKAFSSETALHRAVENRSPKAAMLLIDHGCPIDVADSEGDTALERIAKLPQDGAPASRLYLVFRAAGVDPEQIPQAVWRLFSPLQAAAAVGWTSRCLSLLEQGESERPSESAPSANEWAEQGGHMETASTIRAWLARKQISNIIEQSCSHIMKGIQHG